MIAITSTDQPRTLDRCCPGSVTLPPSLSFPPFLQRDREKPSFRSRGYLARVTLERRQRCRRDPDEICARSSSRDAQPRNGRMKTRSPPRGPSPYLEKLTVLDAQQPAATLNDWHNAALSGTTLALSLSLSLRNVSYLARFVSWTATVEKATCTHTYYLVAGARY